MTKNQIAYTAGDFQFLTPIQRRADGISIVYVLEIASDGAFTVPDLAPGEYNLFVQVRNMAEALDAEHAALLSTNLTVLAGPGEQYVGALQLTRVPTN